MKTKTFDFTRRDRRGEEKTVGSLQLSGSGQKAVLSFYGDICSSAWECWDGDKCPQDISDFLKELDAFSELEIHINSGGGDVFGGVAIYNLLKQHPGQKTVLIDGLAASIASVIALCGDIVIMQSGTQMMIHKPWSFCVGNSDEMLNTADRLDNVEETILDIYMEHVQEDVTRDQLRQMMQAETWMNGREAQQIFRVEASTAMGAAACASDYFDRYKHTPTDFAKQEQEERERLRLELELLRLQ